MIENFEKLTFHRKIDILVAIHVFERKELKIEWRMGDERYAGYWACYREDGVAIHTNIPLYSTLLTSTWDIVRKFDYCYLYKNKNFKDGQWECKLCEDILAIYLVEKDRYYAWAGTEQLAICYAGLKVVEYPLKDFLKEEGKI